MALNPKQTLFAHEYIVSLNATQAAIKAEYSEKTAYSQGQRLLTNPEVQEYIQELMQRRTEKTDVDAEYVLQRISDIDQMDVIDILNDDGSIKPITQWPKIWRQMISGIDVSELFDGKGSQKVLSGILKKIKWPDKAKNLEMMGKHVGVGAFAETKNHKHSFLDSAGNPIDFKVSVSFISPGEVN